MLEIMSLPFNFSPFHSIFGLTKQVSLVSSPECQDWWAAGCRQNASALPANCTVCSAVKSLQIVTDLTELSEKLQGHQPFLIKVMQGFLRLGAESKLLNSLSPQPLPSVFTHELKLLIQNMSKKTFHPSVKMWEDRAPCIALLTNDHCIGTLSKPRCSWMFSNEREMRAGSNSGGTAFIFVSCSLRQGSISPMKS